MEKFEKLNNLQLEPQQQSELQKHMFQKVEPKFTGSRRPMRIRNTFFQDVTDHMATSYLGELDMFFNQDRSYLDEPREDIDFDRDVPSRYRPYKRSFFNVRNRKHMEAIIERIDKNIVIKDRLDYGDRLLPGFVAAAFDPTTLIPIPLAKGLGFFRGSVKAGGAGAGIVAGTEVVRSALDPTSTIGESVGNIGFAFGVSGLFGGIYGRMTETLGEQVARRILADRTINATVEDANQIIDAIDNGINYDDVDVIFNFKSNSPGVVIKNRRDPQNRRVRPYGTVRGSSPRRTARVRSASIRLQDVERSVSETGQTKILQDTTRAEATSAVSDNFRLNTEIASYQIVDGSPQVSVDFVVAKGQFITRKHLQYLQERLGIRVGDNFFKSANDWVNYNIKKAIYKAVYPKFKKARDESTLDYEKRLNKAVIKDTKIESYYLATTDTNELLGMLPNWTNASMVLNTVGKKVKDQKLANEIIVKMIELSGDYATVNKINDLFKATPESVVTAVGTRHNAEIVAGLREIENNFLSLTGADAEMGIFKTELVKTAKATKAFVNNVQDRFTRNARGVSDEMDFKQYSELLGRYVVDPDSLTNQVTDAVLDNLRRSAQVYKKITKFYDDQLAENGMYANNQSYLQLIKKKQFHMNRIRQELGYLDDDGDLVVEQINIDRLGEDNAKRLETMYKRLKDETEFYSRQQVVFQSDRPYWADETYLHRIWKRDAILENEDEFKEILRRNIEEQLADSHSREGYIEIRNSFAMTDAERIVYRQNAHSSIVDAEVEFYFNQITENEARWQDGEGIAGYGFDLDGRYKVGARPLLVRTLKIPNKEVLDFIETDAAFLLRSYSQRVAPAVELAKKFGDTHLNDFLTRTEIDLILQNVKDTDRAAIINAFIDEKDKILGTLYSADPTTFGVRSAQAMKNWASLAYMGRVVYSAIPELARPIMTQGFGSIMKGNIEPFLKGMDNLRKSNLKDLQYLAPVSEMTLQNYMRRFMYDGGITNSRKNKQGWFDKYIGQWLERPQNAFFMLNGLTPWTHILKEFVGLTSMHRFMEDCIKLSAGQLDRLGKRRLASFGIDENMAETIASMPFQKNGDQILANTNAWASRRGGIEARRALANAVFADIQRTIITPNVADRPNMMQGVIRINDEGIAQMLDNPLMRFFGFQKSDLGGKINNAWLALILQFYSYGISSVKRLTTNLVQNRDGVSPAITGGLALVTFGMVADRLKSGDLYEDKPFGEKIVRAVELSGILSLAGDMNFMVETISGGFFDNSYGLRPMVGLDNRFGSPTERDAWGEISGAAPSMLIDLHQAFTDSDLSNRERHAIFRRMLPYNSLWLWDDTFKKTYNSLAGIE